MDLGPFNDALDSGEGQLGAAGERMSGAAKVIGAGIGAALAFALASAINADAANAKLTAQLGLTKDESAKLGKSAGELFSHNYGDSLENVNDALAAVVRNIDGMRNASESDLQDVTAKVLDLSSAFDLDLSESTRAVGVLMKTGMAKNATEALDIITKGLQSPVNAAGDLMDTFTEYSTIFRTMGLDGADALGLLSQGLKGGARDSDQVADSLKELLLRVQAGDANGGLQAIGLDAQKMARDISTGGETAKSATQAIIAAFGGIVDPADKAQVATALFGTKAEDAQQALGALDLKTAASDFEALNGPIAGSAAAMDAALGSGRAAAFETIKRSVQGFATTVGTAMLPILDVAMTSLNGVFAIVSDAAQAFSDLPTPAKILVGVLGAVALAFTGIGTAIKAAFLANPVGIAIVGITTALGFMVSAFGDAKGPVVDLTEVIDAQTGALKENAKATLSAQLEKDGTLAKVRALGVATGDYTDAVLGNSEAQSRVGDILAGNAKKAFDAGAGIDANTGAVVNNSAAADEAQGIYDAYSTSVGDVAAAQAAGRAAAAESGAGFTQIKVTAAEANDALSLLGIGAKGTNVDLTKIASGAAGTIPPLTSMEALFKSNDEASTNADNSLKFFTLSLNAMLGINPTIEQAQKTLNDAVRNTAQAFKDANDATKGHVASLIDAQGHIDTTTKAGSDLYGQLQDMRSAYDVTTSATYNNSLATKGAAGALADAQYAAEQARAKFISNAEAMGIGKEKAGQLADSLGIVEGKKLTDKNFAVNATNVSQTQADLDAINAKKLADKELIIRINQVQVAQKLTGIGSGGHQTLAAGGPVLGSGPKGVDSVAALVAPGEWVLSDRDVDKMGGFGGVAAFLSKLNATSGVAGYATGGSTTIAAPAYAPTPAGSTKIQIAEQLSLALDRDPMEELNALLFKMPRLP